MLKILGIIIKVTVLGTTSFVGTVVVFFSDPADLLYFFIKSNFSLTNLELYLTL